MAKCSVERRCNYLIKAKTIQTTLKQWKVANTGNWKNRYSDHAHGYYDNIFTS